MTPSRWWPNFHRRNRSGWCRFSEKFSGKPVYFPCDHLAAHYVQSVAQLLLVKNHALFVAESHQQLDYYSRRSFLKGNIESMPDFRQSLSSRASTSRHNPPARLDAILAARLVWRVRELN